MSPHLQQPEQCGHGPLCSPALGPLLTGLKVNPPAGRKTQSRGDAKADQAGLAAISTLAYVHVSRCAL
jgi:hypothetical protein